MKNTWRTKSKPMAVAIQEHFEEQHGWSWIGKERCPICGEHFLRIEDANPGSHEQAIMVAFMCKKCEPKHGSCLFDFEDHHFRSEPDYGREHVDLDKEKWDNYYSDYNQCGIKVGY